MQNPVPTVDFRIFFHMSSKFWQLQNDICLLGKKVSPSFCINWNIFEAQTLKAKSRACSAATLRYKMSIFSPISSSGKSRCSRFKLRNGSWEKKSPRAFEFTWMYSKLKLWNQFLEAVALRHCVTIRNGIFDQSFWTIAFDRNRISEHTRQRFEDIRELIHPCFR